MFRTLAAEQVAAVDARQSWELWLGVTWLSVSREMAMGRFSKFCGATVFLAVGLSGALAVAADDPPVAKEGPWRIVLEGQIKKEQGCDLKEVLMYQEIPLGGDTGVEGRISCRDGRQFDFSRKRAHEAFRIELCQPAVC